MKVFLLLLLVLEGAAFTQDCPVKVTYVMKADEHPAGSQVSVSYTNISNKELSKTSFAVMVLDSAGEARPLMASFDSGKHVKLGGKKSESWWVGHDVLDPFTIVKFRAWVQNVQFTDGSTWKDDGSYACVYTKH
jgi:hypothetical protein